MKKVHLPSLPEEELCSPSGRFRSFCKNISAAFGARRRVNEPGEAHPFDLQQRRIPPGAAVCPYHSHAAQWELFVIISGQATVRRDGKIHLVDGGSAFIHPPGSTHQIMNESAVDDLVVFIIADNPAVDIFHYPDSGKFGIRPLGKYFRISEVDYFDGEEPPSTAATISILPQPHATLPLPPFHSVRLDALPWRESQSPAGKFHSFSQDISVALAAKQNATPVDGGHPFDLQVRRLPPGGTVCPLHVHTLQWELFVILSGRALVRANDAVHSVEAGDAFLQKPGTAHQITNDGPEDVTFYVIADNHAADSTYYPNSKKWQMKPQGKLFRMIEVDYFDGEE